MNFVQHNQEMVDAAISKIRQFDDLPVKPRFSIRYEGFGTGSTSAIPVEYAIRYLRDLAAADDPHYRHRTKIKSIAIDVKIPTITISI